jgi:proteic killer suppression protein
MIKSFKNKETEKLFQGRFSSKLPQAIQRSAAIKLEVINAATLLETLRVRRPIIWRSCEGTERGSTAFVSIKVENLFCMERQRRL